MRQIHPITFFCCYYALPASSFLHSSVNHRIPVSLEISRSSEDQTRRQLLFSPVSFLLPAALLIPQSQAAEPDPDLPQDAKKSYLQYRVPLQISADYYLFDLKESLSNVDNWGDVNGIFSTSAARGGQGQPSRLEREFVNPMRILSLSMPPDEAENMRDAQARFERAMFDLSKVTAGIRRDLPVEISPNLVPAALKSWDEGRLALNSFLTSLNDATGLKEMKMIAASKADYPRSERKYLELKKKIKLCQNRGGPSLSQAWGQLMVSGYLQDSCGIPDLEGYFYQ